jgi:integrase
LICRLRISSNTLTTLTAVKLANFRDERLKAGRSTTTVGKYLKLISIALVVGQKELEISITNNPVDLVEKPRPNPPRDRTLNKTELQNLFNSCNGQLRNIVEVTYYTLCRRSEILRLSYNDVDRITSTAIIRETKNGTSRKIGLAPRVIEILKSLPRYISSNFFNITSISSFEKSIRLAVKRSGIKDFRFHDLRHCGATHLVESGWSTMELMQQGGWSSQQMAKRLAIWRRDNKVCEIKKKCEGKYLQFADMDVDHIIPHSKGGKTIVSNGRVSCSECNRSKGAN